MTRERFKNLISEYGQVAFYTYFGLFALVLAGFALAIAWGVQVESAKGSAGVLGAAYVATKLTQPLRIAATLVLTPFVARIASKVRDKNLAGKPAEAHEIVKQDQARDAASAQEREHASR